MTEKTRAQEATQQIFDRGIASWRSIHETRGLQVGPLNPDGSYKIYAKSIWSEIGWVKDGNRLTIVYGGLSAGVKQYEAALRLKNNAAAHGLSVAGTYWFGTPPALEQHLEDLRRKKRQDLIRELEAAA
jgi:hypothetical protein